jgi:hypothetical protein
LNIPAAHHAFNVLDDNERALALGNPNVGWVSYSAASASMKLGDTDAALKWVEKLRLISDPDFVSLKDNFGSAPLPHGRGSVTEPRASASGFDWRGIRQRPTGPFGASCGH